jgi:SAM-dependent methyltransferase
LSSENSKRWEVGCSTDPVRNHFLIPNLARILDASKPRRILDIGTGTGYIPRITDDNLSYRPVWTLVDTDSSRLLIAKRKAGTRMHAEFIESDINSQTFDEPFGAVLVMFTLLEIEDLNSLIERLPSFVVDGGLLVVSLPDAWADVIGYASSEPGKISEFLSGQTSIPKIDKFTNEGYPFKAVRIEHIISRVLRSGFRLEELAENDGGSAKIYLLVFRRRDR